MTAVSLTSRNLFFLEGSGDSSLEKEFTSTIVGPTVSTPNSQHSSPSRSLSANSIKVEMYSDEESSRLLSHDDRLIEKEDSVIVEDSLSEPLGYCDGSGQDPHSPGGIRLPNGKLKCDICGMVCIGPNVLMVHKRSHTVSSPTVGKPYKCNYCGRSYKQQSTLEEHKERCHNYLQSLNTEPQLLAGQQGDEMRDLEMVPDSMLHSSADRPAFIDRLANSITKRKRSTPQKFIGEKQMRYSLSDMAYDVNSSFEKDVEMVAAHHPMDASFGSSLSFMGAEHLRPLRLPPTNCISEITPVISSVYTQIQPLPGRLEIASSREAAEGHEDLSDGTQIVYRASREPSMVSPSNGCQDSTDTESIHEERGSQQPLLSSIGNCSSSRQSPAYAKEDPKLQEGIIPTTTRSTPSSAKEALRVVNDEGEQVKAFKCEHCRILFLDHVMFTIHMGCHGFRDPFECNICGYHSQDRYEFSSHIVRGEHKVG
ncbi:hypothetical protein E2320_016060 [Naja naja]|nr:hypothetical protein E2320_016060 [Naja naja]